MGKLPKLQFSFTVCIYKSKWTSPNPIVIRTDNSWSTCWHQQTGEWENVPFAFLKKMTWNTFTFNKYQHHSNMYTNKNYSDLLSGFVFMIFTQLVSLSSVDKSELLNSHSESCKCQWLNMAVGALRYFPPLPVCHFILTENKLIFFQSNICFMLKEHHLIKFSAGRCLLVFFFFPPISCGSHFDWRFTLHLWPNFNYSSTCKSG